VHVVAAPDKLRGTLSARDAAAAIGRAATAAGHTCDEVPMADGGEGTLDVLGGPNRTTTVTGPLGEPVEAEWRLTRRTAVIEMARASGLLLAGGAEGNDPMEATTAGTGELIRAAVDAGARRIIVGMGGSATTDGGLGALRALSPPQRLKGVEVIVACDVRTRFVDAAECFAAQKGASRAEVKLLGRRLERLAGEYLDEFGVDVRDLEGGGAAGGLAGALATAGGRLRSGFDVVADEVDLFDRLEGAELVVTGEGFIDAESFNGKVVGGITHLADQLSVPALAVAGEVYDRVDDRLPTISLVSRFGAERARRDTARCIEEAVAEHLAGRRGRP
jgi:glycerate kinase